MTSNQYSAPRQGGFYGDQSNQQGGYAAGRYADMNQPSYRNQQGTSQWSQSSNYGDRQQNFSGRGPRDYRRSSDRIREEVCDLLTDNSRLDASDISVKIEDDGVVNLSGSVDSRHSKRLAEDCCDHVRGVSDVRNNLSIDGDFWNKSQSSNTSSSKSKSKSKAKSNSNGQTN